MAPRQSAEIGSITLALHDWHGGRISQRQWRSIASMSINQSQIDELEKIDKFGYSGAAGLRQTVIAKLTEKVGTP